MPYARSDNVRIWYELYGSGPALIMLHGVWGDGGDFLDAGFVQSLEKEFTCVLVDARGHGRSDKLYESSAYSLDLLVQDVIAVADDAGADEAHFFGYSWGGGIGFGVAAQWPHRFRSIIIGGAKSGEPDRARAEAAASAVAAGRWSFEAMLNTQFSPEFSRLKERRLRGDYRAFAAVAQARATFPNLDPALAKIPTSSLLFCGDLDPVHSGAKAAAELLPRAEFVTIPGLDHVGTFAHSEVVLPHIRDFLARVSNPNWPSTQTTG